MTRVFFVHYCPYFHILIVDYWFTETVFYGVRTSTSANSILRKLKINKTV